MRDCASVAFLPVHNLRRIVLRDAPPSQTWIARATQPQRATKLRVPQSCLSTTLAKSPSATCRRARPNSRAQHNRSALRNCACRVHACPQLGSRLPPPRATAPGVARARNTTAARCKTAHTAFMPVHNFGQLTLRRDAPPSQTWIARATQPQRAAKLRVPQSCLSTTLAKSPSATCRRARLDSRAPHNCSTLRNCACCVHACPQLWSTRPPRRAAALGLARARDTIAARCETARAAFMPVHNFGRLVFRDVPPRQAWLAHATQPQRAAKLRVPRSCLSTTLVSSRSHSVAAPPPPAQPLATPAIRRKFASSAGPSIVRKLSG